MGIEAAPCERGLAVLGKEGNTGRGSCCREGVGCCVGEEAVLVLVCACRLCMGFCSACAVAVLSEEVLVCVVRDAWGEGITRGVAWWKKEPGDALGGRIGRGSRCDDGCCCCCCCCCCCVGRSRDCCTGMKECMGCCCCCVGRGRDCMGMGVGCCCCVSRGRDCCMGMGRSMGCCCCCCCCCVGRFRECCMDRGSSCCTGMGVCVGCSTEGVWVELCLVRTRRPGMISSCAVREVAESCAGALTRTGLRSLSLNPWPQTLLAHTLHAGAHCLLSRSLSRSHSRVRGLCTCTDLVGAAAADGAVFIAAEMDATLAFAACACAVAAAAAGCADASSAAACAMEEVGCTGVSVECGGGDRKSVV